MPDILSAVDITHHKQKLLLISNIIINFIGYIFHKYNKLCLDQPWFRLGVYCNTYSKVKSIIIIEISMKVTFSD